MYPADFKKDVKKKLALNLINDHIDVPRCVI